MHVNDLTVEVRDRTLKRVGQVTPLHLDLKARTKWSNVGEWTLTLPGSHAMVGHLSTPGSGIILRGPDGTPDDVILSGPTRTPTRVRNQQNPDGTFTFSGVTDEVILQGARAFPDPSIADPQASSRSKERDARTGSTEDLLRAYVAANLVPGTAPAGRIRGRRKYMTLQGASGGRGLAQQKSPRFQSLLELLQEMVAYDPALGFRVVQVGGALQFQVLDARDRSRFVRFDVENGTIVSEEVQSSGPVVTDAIVAGQGEGTARTIIRRQTLDAAAAEEEWGDVFEEFKDQRDTDDMLELQQSGDEVLLEGQGGTAVKMVPADDTTMQVGRDWRAGDVVTTVVGGRETVARVTEVAYTASSSGVMAGAALGDVSGFTQATSESTRVQSLDQRVSNLERSTAKPGPDLVNPTGSLVQFAGPTAPTGWLLCQGQVLSRADYAALYAVVGTRYNIGGETTAQFRLPDLRGRVPVGQDTSQTEFDVLGERGGSKTHTLTIAQMPSHTHTLDMNTAGYGGGVAQGNIHFGNGAASHPQYGNGTDNPGGGRGFTGGGGAHNNLQPYLTLNFIIKT